MRVCARHRRDNLRVCVNAGGDNTRRRRGPRRRSAPRSSRSTSSRTSMHSASTTAPSTCRRSSTRSRAIRALIEARRKSSEPSSVKKSAEAGGQEAGSEARREKNPRLRRFVRRRGHPRDVGGGPRRARRKSSNGPCAARPGRTRCPCASSTRRLVHGPTLFPSSAAQGESRPCLWCRAGRKRRASRVIYAFTPLLTRMRRRSVTGARQIGRAQPARARVAGAEVATAEAIWSGAAWQTTHSLVVAVAVAARAALLAHESGEYSGPRLWPREIESASSGSAARSPADGAGTSRASSSRASRSATSEYSPGQAFGDEAVPLGADGVQRIMSLFETRLAVAPCASRATCQC